MKAGPPLALIDPDEPKNADRGCLPLDSPLPLSESFQRIRERAGLRQKSRHRPPEPVLQPSRYVE